MDCKNQVAIYTTGKDTRAYYLVLVELALKSKRNGVVVDVVPFKREERRMDQFTSMGSRVR
jgi:hypothetical protein